MKSTQIFILLSPETNLLDLGAIGQVFQEAADMGVPVSTTVCSDASTVCCSMSLSLQGCKLLTEVRPGEGDYLFIISSDMQFVLSDRFAPSTDMLEFVKTSFQTGATLCAVCNGAFLLGIAGLLNNRNCTTHWKRTSELKQRFPLARVAQDVLFVEDNRIITSAGSASGIDLALHVVAKIRDDHFSHKIARELVVFNRRSGQASQHSLFLQFRNHYHQGIHAVQDYLEKNLHVPVQISQLAEMANMSERNFSRIFRREVNLTVFEYINRLRFQVATELSKKPDLSRRQIAHHLGLRSERQVSRILKQTNI